MFKVNLNILIYLTHVTYDPEYFVKGNLKHVANGSYLLTVAGVFKENLCQYTAVV